MKSSLIKFIVIFILPILLASCSMIKIKMKPSIFEVKETNPKIGRFKFFSLNGEEKFYFQGYFFLSKNQKDVFFLEIRNFFGLTEFNLLEEKNKLILKSGRNNEDYLNIFNATFENCGVFLKDIYFWFEGLIPDEEIIEKTFYGNKKIIKFKMNNCQIEFSNYEKLTPKKISILQKNLENQFLLDILIYKN